VSLVTLVSGGLDSSLVAALTKESGIEQFPLFVDYGQRSVEKEIASCRKIMRRLGVRSPKIASIPGYGKLIRSGLTDRRLRVFEDAFTPGRNMMFLTVGAAYAYTCGASGVAIGLLREDTCIFPDQSDEFLRTAERTVQEALGREIKVLAPLRSFMKQDVVSLARAKKVTGSYSCHAGRARPCGNCVACREYLFEEA
jgi:7-cyano-7-deazaguanine synthase